MSFSFVPGGFGDLLGQAHTGALIIAKACLSYTELE